jgi:hypothetical protein
MLLPLAHDAILGATFITLVEELYQICPSLTLEGSLDTDFTL